MFETQCVEREQTIEKTESCFVFRPITLDAKSTIERYTKPWALECSDLSFANLFIWGADGKMEYAEKNHSLYIKMDFEGVPVYFWAPIPEYGKAVDYRKAVYDGFAYMKQIGVEPTYRSVWTPFRDKMLEACPELFCVPTDISWDYVYSRESLATLKGKKLHGKRNHINKFLSQNPDYEYRKLEPSMVPDCIALYEHWSEEKDELSVQLEDEKRSVFLALNNMDVLGLTGGAIYLNEKLCAFTVGERLLPQMQLIHIEKANTDIDGLYPMINQQYILNECEGVEWVNREEDMGLEGMRKAKRSYNPARMVEKYMLSLRDLTDEKGIWGKENV